MTHQMSPVMDVTEEPTASSVWLAVVGGAIDDELLEWPPDLFALTEVLLERSEVYRFALCPPAGLQWPPDRYPFWPAAVADAGRRWSGRVEDETVGVPDLLAEEWEVFREASEMPLADLAEARDWRLCEALLTLHAIADEACAGLGVALTASAGTGCVYRARGRELLARKGSLARIPSHVLRVLPKVRTSPSGSSLRSLSRYACVQGPGVEAHWHNVPGRHPGIEPRSQGANFLLLPWPLRVRESDFRPLEGSVRGPADQPFGFFEFAPSEGLDLDLVDRMLLSAEDEVDAVDVVCLPESAVEEGEIEGLEAVLEDHGVIGLITGVRQPRHRPSNQLPSNWVHHGVSTSQGWVHIRQNKHHRWSLDEEQIFQYHLGGSLHPHIRWWEAMEVPRRAVQFVEVAEGVTFASVVCEDLAQIDDVSDLLRAVGPTIVFTPLLDGPQLTSRWAARYASVLADNPGSSVLTLTSAGMAVRSRPHGMDAVPVVALWKDPARGTREIPLEAGAQGVLLSASSDVTTRHSGDGRWPAENCTEFFDAGVCQICAATRDSPSRTTRSTRTPLLLEAEELTILTSWAKAVAEALAAAPERVDAVLADAGPTASWRTKLGIAEPSSRLTHAIESLRQPVRAAPAGREPAIDSVLAATQEDRPGEQGLAGLAREVLRYVVEERITRSARKGAHLDQTLRTNSGVKNQRSVGNIK